MSSDDTNVAVDANVIDDIINNVKKEPVDDRHKSHGAKQSHLAVQDIATLDATKLTPLTPEVISRQATINIGTIGHVAHGKSTVVKAISGVQTVRFKNELIRNITIKLGYANAKIYRCDGEKDQLGSFRSKGSSTADEFVEDGKTWKLQRHVSFVDCPGHDILMATMLNGAAVMGCCSASSSRKRALSPASNLRAFGRSRDYAFRKYNYFAK